MEDGVKAEESSLYPSGPTMKQLAKGEWAELINDCTYMHIYDKDPVKFAVCRLHMKMQSGSQPTAYMNQCQRTKIKRHLRDDGGEKKKEFCCRLSLVTRL